MTRMDLSLLYRGPLSSCNYGCEYCPFAKHEETYAELETDRVALRRFVDWAERQTDLNLGVLFTPWGEALIRHWYQQALAELTHLPHLRRAAIQTNLSCALDWVQRCDLNRLALWCTYHPSEVPRVDFIARCAELRQRGVRFSVGIVGLKENLAEARALREELPRDVYVWVNAFKRQENYYSADEFAQYEAIDPHFALNTRYHPSLGKSCRAGASAISVDGDGTIRRCHFIANPIGNIYDENWRSSLRERPCSNATCGCHIGYVHLDDLKLYELFGDGVLERIPHHVSTTGL